MEEQEKENIEKSEEQEHQPIMVGDVKVWEISDSEEKEDRRHLAL